jgi:ATP synthase F1 gamma subunit
MKQLQDIARSRNDMATIVQLTNAFEQLASMRIAQTKNKVLRAQEFFDELWNIYSQIRVDRLFRFGRRQTTAESTTKELYIVISAAGGFSGDIDNRLVAEVMKTYKPANNDIIVIGRHGARLLREQGVDYAKYFTLPESDNYINVEPLVREIRRYPSTVVYYQAYESFLIQSIKRIELISIVKELSERSGSTVTDTINEHTYIFEPGTYEVIAYLERSMVQITLSQLIFDSKLAQYASRFKAMNLAYERADNSLGELDMLYKRTRRSLRDERLKEVVNGLKKAGATL